MLFDNPPIVLHIFPTEIQAKLFNDEKSLARVQVPATFFKLTGADLDLLLQKVLGEGLHVNPVEHPVLIIEPSYPTNAIRVKMNQFLARGLLISLGVPAVSFIPLVASGRPKSDLGSWIKEECTTFREENWVLRGELKEYYSVTYVSHSIAARMEILRAKLKKMGLLTS